MFIKTKTNGAHGGSNQKHPKGVDDKNPNAPAPDRSTMTIKMRQDLSCRLCRGHNEVLIIIQKYYQKAKKIIKLKSTRRV
jgi:hypothetical protein